MNSVIALHPTAVVAVMFTQISHVIIAEYVFAYATLATLSSLSALSCRTGPTCWQSMNSVQFV